MQKWASTEAPDVEVALVCLRITQQVQQGTTGESGKDGVREVIGDRQMMRAVLRKSSFILNETSYPWQFGAEQCHG